VVESAEYCDNLLDKASGENDSIIRLAFVSTFMMSRFCTAVSRLQKPFNPLLGETYELVTNKFRLITEQVSHHPPITAYHIEASSYEVFSQQFTTTKFNGRSIITQPPNRIYILLKLSNG